LEVSFNMRYVPPGRFQRDGGAANISVINEGYWMGETEVTQQLWTAVMGYNPSHERHEQLGYLRRRQSFLAQGIWMPVLAVLDFLSGAAPEIKTMPESALFKAQARLNERLWRLAHSNPGTPFDPEGERAELLPVETVNWYDAITFCNKLSLLDGLTPVYSVEGVSDWGTFHYNYIPFEAGDPRNAVWDRAVRDADANGYRLPTEMEWMWAAMGAERGGDDVRTNGYAKTFAGESGASLLINYVWDHGTAGQRTHQTGLKYANELGLFDMSGNVSEWCCDRDAALPPMTLYDYQGPSAPGTGRIVKGVHFYSYQGATLASRSGLAAYLRDEYYGFRIVRMRN
jgi:formylglycine-generating enzyme required for sulfatase activity